MPIISIASLILLALYLISFSIALSFRNSAAKALKLGVSQGDISSDMRHNSETAIDYAEQTMWGLTKLAFDLTTLIILLFAF